MSGANDGHRGPGRFLAHADPRAMPSSRISHLSLASYCTELHDSKLVGVLGFGPAESSTLGGLRFSTAVARAVSRRVGIGSVGDLQTLYRQNAHEFRKEPSVITSRVAGPTAPLNVNSLEAVASSHFRLTAWRVKRDSG